MKDLIRSILFAIAIYSGAIAANSHDYVINFSMATLCGLACGVFVVIKNDEED